MVIELESVGITLGAAFYGYTLGATLFGITIAQAYQFFLSKHYGPRWQRYIIGAILILDTLHFTFAMHMMYTFLLQALGEASAESKAVRSLQSMGSVQVFFTIFVQALYLNKIWNFSKNALLTDRFGLFLRGVVVVLSLMAIGVGVGFLIELQKIESIRHFDLRFEYVIYIGFGATAFIDMAIAAVVCVMLHKSSANVSKRSNKIVVTLIQYIVGTGLLTSLGALLIMILYIAWPGSLLYLGVEYSMTRLYAISVLALYNSQARLRDKFNETVDLNGASMLYFAEPDKLISHPRNGDNGLAPHGNGNGVNGVARGQTLDSILGSLANRDDGSSYQRQGYHRRDDTFDSTLSGGTPDSRRPFDTRMFENVDAEDTLVERAHRNGNPLILTPSRNGRNGRHNTA